MKIPTIEEAAKFDDAQIADLLGHQQEIVNFKEEITELNKLTGAARDEADELWYDRIKPSISSFSIKYIKEDALRSVKTDKELGQDVMDSAEPSSVL